MNLSNPNELNVIESSAYELGRKYLEIAESNNAIGSARIRVYELYPLVTPILQLPITDSNQKSILSGISKAIDDYYRGKKVELYKREYDYLPALFHFFPVRCAYCHKLTLFYAKLLTLYSVSDKLTVDTHTIEGYNRWCYTCIQSSFGGVHKL